MRVFRDHFLSAVRGEYCIFFLMYPAFSAAFSKECCLVEAGLVLFGGNGSGGECRRDAVERRESTSAGMLMKVEMKRKRSLEFVED